MWKLGGYAGQLYILVVMCESYAWIPFFPFLKVGREMIEVDSGLKCLTVGISKQCSYLQRKNKLYKNQLPCMWSQNYKPVSWWYDTFLMSDKRQKYFLFFILQMNILVIKMSQNMDQNITMVLLKKKNQTNKQKKKRKKS